METKLMTRIKQSALSVGALLMSLNVHSAQLELTTASDVQNNEYGPGEDILVDVQVISAAGELDGLVLADMVLQYETDVLELISVDTSATHSDFYYDYALPANTFPIVHHNNSSALGLLQVIVGIPGSQAIAAGSTVKAAQLHFRLKTTLPDPLQATSTLTLVDGSVDTFRDAKVVLNDSAGSDVLLATSNKVLALTTFPDTDSDGVHDNIDTDDDNDGMSDLFEEQYAFLDPLDASDGPLDEDGDSVSNAQEFIDGTDPDNRTVYIGAPEICGDGIDQNLDGEETGFSDPANLSGNVVCDEVAPGQVEYYAYDADDQLLFTIDSNGFVSESRYNPAQVGQVLRSLLYRHDVYTDLLAWQLDNQTNQFPAVSAPSASDIHSFLIDKPRRDGRLHTQLLANGEADYPFDAPQWSAGARWSVTHESDERRFMNLVRGVGDTATLRQRFSLLGFDSNLINNGGLELQFNGSDFSESMDVGMNSRWVVKFYTAGGTFISPIVPPKDFELSNSWQDREFFVQVPSGAAEVQVELQIVMDFACKGPTASNDVCSTDVPVYFDHISIAAVKTNQRALVTSNADRDQETLYSYDSLPIEATTYYVYDGSDRLQYAIAGDGVVTQTLYHGDGQTSEEIVYSSVSTAVEQWALANPGAAAPSAADVQGFLSGASITNHVKYHTSFNGAIGQMNSILFSDIVEVVVGSGPSIDRVENPVDGSAVINGSTVEFTPSGATGSEGFDVVLTGDVSTVRISLTLN